MELEELNALIAKEKLNGADFGIDPRLVRHVPVKLRVVLEWDADESNLDLIGGTFTDGWLSPIRGSFDLSGAWRSGDTIGSYGPESLCVQDLFPGGYSFGARFYGDWNDEELSTVTAAIEVIHHFGTPEEVREVHTLRLEEKTDAKIVKARVELPGWE